MRKVLFLNSSYEPLSLMNWQRAFLLSYLDKVDVLAYYERFKINSAGGKAYSVPAVVKSRDYIKTRKSLVRFSRTNIYLRDKYVCQYCGKPFGPKSLTFDHIIPKSRGGETTWNNIVTACKKCNVRKKDKTPEEARMPLLNTPKLTGKDWRLLLDIEANSIPREWIQFLPGIEEDSSLRISE